MPELPEVATMVKAFKPRLIGRLVRHVLADGQYLLEKCEPGNLQSALVGTRVRGVFRRGKYVRVDFEPSPAPGRRDAIWRRPPSAGSSVALTRPARLEDLVQKNGADKPGRSGPQDGDDPAPLLNDWRDAHARAAGGRRVSLLLHLKMTGRFFLMNDNGHPVPTRTRFVLAVSDGEDDLLFGLKDARRLARARLVEGDEAHGWPEWLKLGPDALDTRWTGARLARQAGGSLPIKLALLDQGRLSGIGNIYASELLHRTRIHPARPADRLTAAEWNRLAREIPRLLRHSMKNWCHLSRWIGPAVEGYGDFQGGLAVYDRAGRKCRRCRGTIETLTQGGRTTYCCPECQE